MLLDIDSLIILGPVNVPSLEFPQDGRVGHLTGLQNSHSQPNDDVINYPYLCRDFPRLRHHCSVFHSSMPESTKEDKGRAYHTKCTGAALNTVNRQDKDEDITLFGSCFCPFVQRVWVAFEFLGVPYKVRLLFRA